MDEAVAWREERNAVIWSNTGGNGERQRCCDERIDERAGGGMRDDGYDNDTDRSRRRRSKETRRNSKTREQDEGRDDR